MNDFRPDTERSPDPPGLPPGVAASLALAEQWTDKPHDGYFRAVFALPVPAAAELAAVLPPELAARIEWDRLTLRSGSLVHQDLRGRVTDLQFDVPIDGAAGVVVIEHQSSVEFDMAARMLEYMSAIWANHRRASGGQLTVTDRYPTVVTLVVHQGPGRWTAPQAMADLLAATPAGRADLGRAAPLYEYFLDDLGGIGLGALRARGMPTVALVPLAVITQLAGSKDLGFLWELVDELSDLTNSPLGREVLALTMTYIGIVSGDIDTLTGILTSLGSTAQETYMSIITQLREQGRAEGEAAGEARGEARGRAELLVSLLTQRFGEPTAQQTATINNASVETLDRWALRVLDADSIDQVLSA